jgi:hypothetical protein
MLKLSGDVDKTPPSPRMDVNADSEIGIEPVPSKKTVEGKLGKAKGEIGPSENVTLLTWVLAKFKKTPRRYRQ